MARARRWAAAVAACGIAVAGVVVAAAPGDAQVSSPASRHDRAVLAVRKFETGGYADRGLPARHALWVRACYRGACAHDRLRPNPTCDPKATTCLGPAYRAVRITRRLVVEATYG